LGGDTVRRGDFPAKENTWVEGRNRDKRACAQGKEIFVAVKEPPGIRGKRGGGKEARE